MAIAVKKNAQVDINFFLFCPVILDFSIVRFPTYGWIHNAPHHKIIFLLLFFIVLFYSSYDSGEYEVLFLKIGARVPDLLLDTYLGSKWPKWTLYAPDHQENKFVDISRFFWINLMILENMRSCLWKLELGF